ncbi:thioesterase domain-containing protein [Streptomyces violaceusniger]|uniref:thioesterase domain-containing protein n=1 Tax=Streptomyces violaceusniger TaxID=68280 RepID=UPI00099635BE
MSRVYVHSSGSKPAAGAQPGRWAARHRLRRGGKPSRLSDRAVRPAGGPARSVAPLDACATRARRTHQAAKFAPCFDGERDMFEIQYPGLVAGEVVPRDWDTLVAMHAETVRAQFGDLRIALLGHSIGGCTAQAVAAKSIELGSPPAGLVLGDTYPVTEANSSQDWLLDLPASRVTRAGVQFEELTGDTPWRPWAPTTGCWWRATGGRVRCRFPPCWCERWTRCR